MGLKVIKLKVHIVLSKRVILLFLYLYKNVYLLICLYSKGKILKNNYKERDTKRK